MATLFFSFIHEDLRETNLVRDFVQRALSFQIDSFLSCDETQSDAGEDGMKHVFAELNDAKVLLAMLSPESVKRPWIHFEAGAAWMSGKAVIPVCYGGIDVGDLPKPYSGLEATDVQTFDGLHSLACSTARYLDLPKPRRPVFEDDPDPIFLGADGIAGNQRLFEPYRDLHSFFESKNIIRNLQS
ncbi:MAG TPA: TIR domain-containing protein [Terracidiphilus sp.]|nr:TIR domain-containing protein [Terracidiphilus sp.]